MAIGHANGATPDILSQIADQPHTFLQPTSDLATAAFALVKELLDPLAAEVSDVQKVRRDSNRRKRKRVDDVDTRILQLRKVHTAGLGVRQVWEQARRILDSACEEIERDLPQDEEGADDESRPGVLDGTPPLENGYMEEDDASDIHSGEGDGEDDINGMDGDSDEVMDDIEGGEDRDIENIEDDEEMDDLDIEANAGQAETYAPDPNGLNDGFFSIDDFNKQSQFLEQMDARGDDDNPSDEDDVDWEVDPASLPAKSSVNDLQDSDPAQLNDDDDDDDEAGPTFGNASLDAPESDEDADEYMSDDLDSAMLSLNNTNDIRYADFFEPPPKKPSKTKRMRALPKTQPPKSNTATGNAHAEDLEADILRAMDDANRDIFASESEGEDEADSDADGPSTKNMSTHEKQRAKIAAEIRRLEAASVAKRDWTLSGEARAAERPVNSLIEEDLEFERAGKPVPVVTAETTEEIEALIKRRIIAREFDEVIRRRPDAIGTSSDARRGRVEVDDRKAETGLADIYEQEHLKTTDPNYVDKRSVSTKKQHAEIDRLWKEVSYQLDLLSNLHFKPKRLEVEVKIVEDKPTISMEDARPSGEVGQSMLAPQEVYKAGEAGKRDGEVMRKSGASLNKEELTRVEKVRKRRRDKERLKKQQGNTGASAKTNGLRNKKSKGVEKQDIISELKKGNVRVIDKKGDLQSLTKTKGAGEGQASSSALKL